MIKLGGSLLDYGYLVGELRRWLALQSPARNLLVVGGGAMADVVRRADRLHSLGESAAHGLCVRAMAVNSRMIAALLPEAIYATAFNDTAFNDTALNDTGLNDTGLNDTSLNSSGAAHRQAKSRQAGLSILDPWHFLREVEPRCAVTPLPQSWDATSDSIAAQVAVVWRAAELVLLKSALPPASTSPASTSLADASTVGYVDGHFPIAAKSIPTIRCVNLRERKFPETTLRTAEKALTFGERSA